MYTVNINVLVDWRSFEITMHHDQICSYKGCVLCSLLRITIERHWHAPGFSLFLSGKARSTKLSAALVL